MHGTNGATSCLTLTNFTLPPLPPLPLPGPGSSRGLDTYIRIHTIYTQKYGIPVDEDMEGREPRHEEGQNEEHPQARLARLRVPVEHLERHAVILIVLVVVDHVVEDVHHEEVETHPREPDLHLRGDQELVYHLCAKSTSFLGVVVGGGLVVKNRQLFPSLLLACTHIRALDRVV